MMDHDRTDPGPVERADRFSLALRAQARRGFAPTELMRNEELLLHAQSVGLDAPTRPELGMRLFQELAAAVDDLDAADRLAARALLGVAAPDHAGASLTLRREAAAAIDGRSVDSFRKNREPALFKAIADKVLMHFALRSGAARTSSDFDPRADSGLIDTSRVLMIHGRDRHVAESVTSFLRSLGLRPIEWGDALAETGLAAPDVSHALRAALDLAQAIVVVLSAEENGQPRANVLFETGLAMGIAPSRTLLVSIGDVALPSDLASASRIRLTDTAASRNALRSRLSAVGCSVFDDDDSWLSVGVFDTSGQPLARDTANRDGRFVRHPRGGNDARSTGRSRPSASEPDG